MARIEIESAYVEPWTKNEEQHPAWGMKTAETHSRKKEGGGYETVGRTFRTVKVSRASGIDLTQFRKGDRVHIWGSESTETREHEGKKYYDLVCWADRIEVAEARTSAPASEPQETWNSAPPEDPWPVADIPADTVWPTETFNGEPVF